MHQSQYSMLNCKGSIGPLAHPRQQMPKRILGHCISVQWIDIASTKSTKSIAGRIRSSGFAPNFVQQCDELKLTIVKHQFHPSNIQAIEIHAVQLPPICTVQHTLVKIPVMNLGNLDTSDNKITECSMQWNSAEHTTTRTLVPAFIMKLSAFC